MVQPVGPLCLWQCFFISSDNTIIKQTLWSPLKEFFYKWEKLVQMRLCTKIVEEEHMVGGRAGQKENKKYQHLKKKTHGKRQRRAERGQKYQN